MFIITQLENQDFTCPCCGAVLTTTIGARLDSSMLKVTCPYCKHEVYNPSFTELAFKPYKKQSVLKTLVLSIAYGLFPSLLIFYFLNKIMDMDIAIIISLAISTLIIFAFLMSVKDKTDNKYLRLWQESYERLQNKQYVQELVDAGYDVPEVIRKNCK